MAARMPVEVNPRSLCNEAQHLPASIEDLVELGDQLTALGHGPDLVRGILGWLALKAAGRPDRTAATTRARYRRILSELDRSVVDRVIPGLLASSTAA